MDIVTDFIDGGDLHQLWQESGSFDEDLVKIYAAEIALVIGEIVSVEFVRMRFGNRSVYRFSPQRRNYLPRLENGKHSDRFLRPFE